MSSDTKETWENVSGSQIYLRVYDSRGNETVVHLRPGQRQVIRQGDREANQDLAASDLLDPFKNGMLVPAGSSVKMFDSAEEYKDIVANSNSYSDSDLLNLFKSKGKAFNSKIEAIDGITVIRRLLDLANSEEVGATMPQVRAIQKRFEELDDTPKNIFTDPEEPLPPVGIS